MKADFAPETAKLSLLGIPGRCSAGHSSPALLGRN